MPAMNELHRSVSLRPGLFKCGLVSPSDAGTTHDMRRAVKGLPPRFFSTGSEHFGAGWNRMVAKSGSLPKADVSERRVSHGRWHRCRHRPLGWQLRIRDFSDPHPFACWHQLSCTRCSNLSFPHECEKEPWAKPGVQVLLKVGPSGSVCFRSLRFHGGLNCDAYRNVAIFKKSIHFLITIIPE